MRFVLPLCLLSLFIIACLSCTSGGKSEAVNKRADSIVNATPDMGTISKIISATWIEVSNEEKRWMLIPRCDAEIPSIIIHRDTLELNWGDGGIDKYKVKSAAFGKGAAWNLQAISMPDDPTLIGDTLTIYVNMIDTDKSHWRIGAGYQADFLDDRFANNYPKKVIDCDD